MSELSTSSVQWSKVSIYTRRIVTVLVAGLIGVLSYPVVKNVLSPSQVCMCLLHIVLIFLRGSVYLVQTFL